MNPVKAFREKHGLSIAELARVMGLGTTCVKEFMNGRGSIKQPILDQINYLPKKIIEQRRNSD